MASRELSRRIGDALNNRTLRDALGRFADSYVGSRAAVYQGLDFRELRDRIAAAKARAAGRMDQIADQFESQLKARGAKVYRAEGAEDACRYILNLAREKGVRSVVKSKSMATEEIGLNHYLEAEGVEVVETDLGERIIQLAGQKPSHMVMPAIHLTKEEIARIFSKSLGREVAAEAEGLVKLARRELRKSFMSADMGITGANIAIAETGSIIIITNEGNARLTTTLPPVHVAVVGYEKIVEKVEDAYPILRALPKSATAQPITSYVTMISGPNPAEREGEPVTGEMHVVLLDNGRRKMRDDPVFKEALQCIRCASCLNVCPVYRLVGGHVYGDVYTGGIGSILLAFFSVMEAADDPAQLCIGCRRCTEFCPGKIDIPRLILELRSRLVEHRGQGLIEKEILGILAKPGLFRSLLKAGKGLQGIVTGGGEYIRRLPGSLDRFCSNRSLPALAPRPLRDLVGDRPEPAAERGTIAFYAGCVIDFAYPKIGTSVIESLEKAGYRVVFPEGQSCCGAPALYSGDKRTAKALARQNVDALDGAGADFILTACPTCEVALVEDFPRLLEDDPEYAARARDIAGRTRDFSSFMADVTTSKESDGERGKVTYHDSCHLRRSLGVHREPRRLLASAGYEVVEMKDSDHCCGFGGSYTVKFPQLSDLILERKLDNIEASGAGTVAVDCPGCLIQLRGGLDKRESPIRVKHTAELLAETEGGNDDV